VNSGAFDSFEELCPIARDAGAWIHIDGAFGLWAKAATSLSHLTRGMDLADSWATDAHKWLNVPYDSGIAFVRDADALRSSMAITAEYLPPPGARRNPSDYTPNFLAARGVEVWSALLHLGREGLAVMIERNCAQSAKICRTINRGGL
jgi:glutamate/tyrosine decarboxylase-like PLP-dependent enzyme